MTAETVRSIMGEPAEIRPMQSPAGKAETWIYHRTTTGVTKQLMIGDQISQQIETIDLTISLLMFNDRLMEQKQTTQHHLEYK